MPINSRTKGHGAEREVASLFRDHLGIDVERNLVQTRSGGCDLLGVPNFAVEVKRYAKATDPLKRTWWDQACRQANDIGLEPCVIFREDRKPWKAIVAMPDYFDKEDHRSMVEMDIELFMAMVRESMNISI